MRRSGALGIIAVVTLLLSVSVAAAEDVLPFPTPPMGGKVGRTMQESLHNCP